MTVIARHTRWLQIPGWDGTADISTYSLSLVRYLIVDFKHSSSLSSPGCLEFGRWNLNAIRAGGYLRHLSVEGEIHLCRQ